MQVENDIKTDVYVTPLPTVRGFAKGMRRLALIVVGGPVAPDALPSSQDLRDFFDITPAESKVAQLLCGGYVAKEISRELQVGMATIRSQLRALLEKTGTTRQTELIQLLSSLPRTAPDDAARMATGGRYE